MEIQSTSNLQPYMTLARAELARALIEPSPTESSSNSALEAPQATSKQVAAPTYGYSSQEISNATEVAVMSARVEDTEVVSKAQAEKEHYQADIERAEQALRDAALLANEARQRQDLMDIFQDALSQDDEGDASRQDNYLDGVQRFSEAETKLTFAAARDSLEVRSGAEDPQRIRSILI